MKSHDAHTHASASSETSSDALSDELAQLADVLSGRKVVVLTGAGCSTESGIPDYRGQGRPASPRAPIQHDEFVKREEVRRRYWARSTLGWTQFSTAAPNPAHEAIAQLEATGGVVGIITQNVDGLHQQAGSRRVVELHGGLAQARCLSCDHTEPRATLQERLLAANPRWLERGAAVAPDGDADISPDDAAAFRLVACAICAGVLKPDVVLFGGSVPETTLARAWALFEEANALLVVGTSLAVYSGFRFIRRAHEGGIPIGVINLGPTRADDVAKARVSARAGDVLPRLAVLIGSRTVDHDVSW